VSIVQKSIPFPPIRLEKIVNYLLYIKDRSASVQELKDCKIDFGRGRGDITRFLLQIGIVESEGSRIKLSNIGKIFTLFLKDGKPSIMFKILFNNYMIDRVLTYRVLIETLREFCRADFENLYLAMNENLKKISPSLWINKVAYRSLIMLANDLEILEKRGSTLTYVGHYDKVKTIVNLCIVSHRDVTYLDLDKLCEMLGFLEKNLLLKIVSEFLVKVRSPSAIELFRVRDIEGLICRLCSVTVFEVMKFSSPE